MEEFDPIMLEVLWNRLVSIVNEQAAALIRASFTTIVRETEDLSAGIFDKEGNMVVQAVTGTPGHINTMATGVKHFLKRFPPSKLEPGDVLITNDPWLVSGHKHDITIVTPIYYGEEIEAYAASTCHVEDIGGRVLSADAPDVFEEGLEIPVMKLFKAGNPNEDLFEIIESNVRVPLPVLGDIHAQVAANEVSRKKIVEFLKEYKFKSLLALSHKIMSLSEDATRKAFSAIPEGEYSNEVYLDGFDEPIIIAVTLKVRGSSVLADYTGTSPQSNRGINVVFNYTHAYTTYPIKTALCPELPNNDGSFRPIKVYAPEGCVLNAKFPAPVAGRHLTGHFAAFAVYGALAKIAPDRVNAESSILGLTQFDGVTDDADIFVKNYFCTGGMGARPNKDGLSAVGFPTNIANAPIEVTENTSPLFFTRKELISDSGGPGKYRGGLAQRVGIKIMSKYPAVFSCLYERTKFPARGYCGGLSGRKADVILNEADHPHPKKKCPIKPGDEVWIELAGGGGFYPPQERDPEMVLRDLLNGFISLEAAANIYKVKIDPSTMKIDWAATEALRCARDFDRLAR